MMKKIFSRTLSALLAVMMVISSMVMMALPTAAAETSSTIDMGDNSVNDLYTPRPADVEAWDGTAATEFAGGKGTPEDPYLIATPGQYKLFADNCVYESQNATGTTWLSSCYKLVADLYINDFYLTANMGYGEGNMPQDTSPKCQIIPVLSSIDTVNTQEYPCTFSGTFDGDGHTIYNAYWSRGNNLLCSMFGHVSGTIKNLNVKGGFYNFLGWRGSGGILASSLKAGGSIINCHVNAHIVTQRDTAGIVVTKAAGSTLENCTFSGKIATTTNRGVAGIVGTMYAGSSSNENLIKNCINYADLKTGSHSNGNAGIVRYANNYVRFIGCVNYGDIVSTVAEPVGGICADAGGATHVWLENCINYGDITAIENTGGLIGITRNTGDAFTELTDCYNYGKITSQKYTGGMIGAAQSPIYAVDCANYGAVTATTSTGYAGGFAGFINQQQWANSGMVAHNCANYGTITSDIYAGGFAGRLQGGMSKTASHLRGLLMTNCVSAGKVTSKAGTAGSAIGQLLISSPNGSTSGKLAVTLENVWLNGALCAADSNAITALVIGSNVYMDMSVEGFAGATSAALFESAQQYSATAMANGSYLTHLNNLVNDDLGDEMDILWYQSTALGAPAPVTNLKVSQASVSVGTTPAIAVLLSGVAGLPADATVELVNSKGKAVAATKVDGSRYRFDFGIALADIGLSDTYHIMVNGQKSIHSYDLSVANLLGAIYAKATDAEKGLMVAMVNYSFYAGNQNAFNVFNAAAGTAFAPSVDGAAAIAGAGNNGLTAGYEAALDIEKGFVIIVTKDGEEISKHTKSVLNATDIIYLGDAGSISVAAMLNHYLGDPAHADLAKAAILFYEAAVAAQDEAALGQ